MFKQSQHGEIKNTRIIFSVEREYERNDKVEIEIIAYVLDENGDETGKSESVSFTVDSFFVEEFRDNLTGCLDDIMVDVNRGRVKRSR